MNDRGMTERSNATRTAPRRQSFYRRHGKRWLDLALTVPALVVLAPLFLGLALMVRWRLGSPILFRQPRIGLHGQTFTLVKVRTMDDQRDPLGKLRPDSERLPPFGRWLRRTSLDELPELIHVLRGEMSLVGPRPLLVEYLDRYSPEQRRRHEVLPGLTGLAQIRGRNALTWEEKFASDVEYVERVGLTTDLSILSRTVLGVLRGEGVSAGDHATMPKFEGNSGGDR